VITSLSFEKETKTRVYFFDTDALELLKQGVIVRVRQGADNDLTVKVRVPAGSNQANNSKLREHFPCEIDRTGAGEDTDYSVRCKYKAPQVAETGVDISSLLSPSQVRLLREARAAIDWARVRQIANIKSTKWETTAQSPFRKLALSGGSGRRGTFSRFLPRAVLVGAREVCGITTAGEYEGPIVECRTRYQDEGVFGNACDAI
jgi:hypothetical protein